MVLKDFDLPDWERVRIEPGRLSVVGPVAAQALAKHGLLWPFNTYLHHPILRRAAGGSVVTGFGGDEIGSGSAGSRAERLLVRQERAGKWATASSLGLALAPVAVKEAVYRHRFAENRPWLTDRGYRLARAAVARNQASLPFGFDRKLTHWVRRSRYFQVCQASFQALASPSDVRVFHPLVAPEVLWALAGRGGIPGLGRAPTLSGSSSGACCHQRS